MIPASQDHYESIPGSEGVPAHIFAQPTLPGFLSVIIPVGADPEGLEKTLQSLEKQTLPRTAFEIIVGNDGAHPSVEALCRRFQVFTCPLPVSRGSYAARNLALRQSHGEFLAFTDADIIVPADWCARGLAALQTADYVAGSVQIQDTSPRPSGYDFERICVWRVEKNLNPQHYGLTANLFLRRSVLEKLGGFDERLRSAGDLELGDRVYRTGGFRQSQCPDITVSHPGRTFAQICARWRRMLYGNWHLYQLYPERFPWPSLRWTTPLEWLLPPKMSLLIFQDREASLFHKIQAFLIGWIVKLILIPEKITLLKTARIRPPASGAASS